MVGMTETYPPEATFRPLEPIHVLLVEDDPDAAQLTSSQVSHGEIDNLFRIEWTVDLKTAIQRLSEPGIDVVLLDLGLPEITGHKTHQAIASVVGNKTPVVILTSDDSADSRHITIGQGAKDYLVKSRASAVQIRQALHEATLENDFD
jgi:DNA-binding response OmpR family regulator